MAKTQQEDTAPVAEWDGLGQFRKLWNGGEHRRAHELATSASLSEDGWAALHEEFPGLLELING